MLLLLPVSRQSINQFCAGCVKYAMQVLLACEAIKHLFVNHASKFAVFAPVWAVWVQHLQFLACRKRTAELVALLESVCRGLLPLAKHCCQLHASHAQWSHLNNNRVVSGVLALADLSEQLQV